MGPEGEWLLANADRIGAYFLLLVGVWALVTGRLITTGRLADWQALVTELRAENKQLRDALANVNATLEKLADAQKETTARLLAALAESRQRRTG